MYLAVTLLLKLKNAQLISQPFIVPSGTIFIANALGSWKEKAGS